MAKMPKVKVMGGVKHTLRDGMYWPERQPFVLSKKAREFLASNRGALDEVRSYLVETWGEPPVREEIWLREDQADIIIRLLVALE